MIDSDFSFELRGWPGIAVAAGLLVLGLSVNYYIFRYNPKQAALVESLQSDDPAVIGQALYESGKFTMGKGHKLIPCILPHLSDHRDLPEELKQKIISEIQATPGSIPGIESEMARVLSIGYTAALTLQSLVIKDVESKRWVGGKYRARIVEYVLDEIGPYSDELTVANGLWSVTQIHDERLVPFWFQCLEKDSESIRTAALSGLSFYIYDRTHGILTWHPEKEIDAKMIENLQACTADHRGLVSTSASHVLDELAKAGLDAELTDD
ncbi:MAG: hypothetical protein CSA81_02025 [Acidobacteria bacterium]|nr:MAG: hypothetical protein CSA81_02025 [Acidobacteriota bacterium]